MTEKEHGVTTEAAETDEPAPAGGAKGEGPEEEEPGLAEEAAAVAESAAELGVGAIIAPFAGGQTVDMVESLVEIVEAGVDRLAHLGHPDHPSRPGKGEEEHAEEDEDRAE